MKNLRRAVLAVVSGVATLAVATTAPRSLSDEDMVAAAGFVLAGTVERVEGAWSADGTQIHSYVDVRVGEVLKGTLTTDVIRLRVLGGEVAGFGMQVVDGPAFVPGEEAVFFLEPNPQSLFPVVGLSAGKVSIATDQVTSQRSVPARATTRDAYLERLRVIVAQQAHAAGPAAAGAPLQPKTGGP